MTATATAAREARRDFEAVLDRPWSRLASRWLDLLLVIEEAGL